MNLKNVVIVLDHPDESRNIGAVCRAMANNDIKTLRIVGSKENYDIEHIHVLAIHAGYIFDNAEFFENLTDAVKDCCICAGTTRRRGKKRGKLLLPEEFAREAAKITDAGTGSDGDGAGTGAANFYTGAAGTGTGGGAGTGAAGTGTGGGVGSGAAIATSAGIGTDAATGIGTGGGVGSGAAIATSAGIGTDAATDIGTGGGKIALVFGNERTGLTDDQLDECTMGVTIPSSDEFGSLNLSHAVQIMCYQLFRQNRGEIRGYNPITLERLGSTVKTISTSLEQIGFFKLAGRNDMEMFWRDVLSRANLSEGEAQYIEKTFTKMAGLAKKNSSKNGNKSTNMAMKNQKSLAAPDEKNIAKGEKI